MLNPNIFKMEDLKFKKNTKQGVIKNQINFTNLQVYKEIWLVLGSDVSPNHAESGWSLRLQVQRLQVQTKLIMLCWIVNIRSSVSL